MEIAEKKVVRKIALAVLQDQKILLARYKGSGVFYFVGGQIRPGESESDCLVRKVPDEIGAAVDPESLSFLGEFEDEADGRTDTLVNISLYSGRLISKPIPTNDVEEIRFFDTQSEPLLLSAIAVHQIFPWLREQAYIH